jgi:hypothetical protein
MERYFGVRGHKNVKKMLDALERAGARITRLPDPTVAPFEASILTKDGEALDLVLYAFTANKYGQGGRPSDEHRFQVKYGSDFKRAHPIHIDHTSSRITLMLGVHDTKDVLIAVDPAAHNPTWFSSSIEFKSAELDQAVSKGWHCWERERVASGRRRIGPDESLTTEVLVAFRPEHLVTFARFERLATGMDAGERAFLSDQVERSIARGRSTSKLLSWPPPISTETGSSHPILKQMGLSVDELLATLQSRFRLFAAVKGSVAEVHLGRALRAMSHITAVEHVDADGQPDFTIRYNGRPVRIECKNVLGKLSASKSPRVDFQKTRASKGNPCSRYYSPEQFEVLAACLHPVTHKWEFQYCATRHLAPHKKCPGRLSERVVVEGSHWSPSLSKVLGSL